MKYNERHTTDHTDAKESCLPWLLALGAGLVGVSFSFNSAEQNKPVPTPPLGQAVQFPKNIKPGIALIHVDELAQQDPAMIVQEFQQAHPNLTVLTSEPFTDVVPHWGTRNYLKIVYEIDTNAERCTGESKAQ